MTRYSVATTLLLPLLLNGACGGARASTPASLSQANVPSVVLLDAGTEPREPLRYALAEHTTITGVFVLRVVSPVEGQHEDAATAPTVRATVAASPIDRDASGARYDLTISGIEVVDADSATERQAALTRSVANALEGRTTSLAVDDRGYDLGSSTGLGHGGGPGDLDVRLLTVLGSLQGLLREVPLPRGPVGPGATWDVRREIRVDGVELAEVSRYIVTTAVGAQMRISIGLQQTALPQSLDRADGNTVDLRSHTLRAQGHAIVDLEAPLPMELYFEVEGLTVFGIAEGDPEVPQKEQQIASLHLFMDTPEVAESR